MKAPQLYDGFSPIVYFWLEALGLCAAGEAHRFVQDGDISVERGGCRSSPAVVRSATAGVPHDTLMPDTSKVERTHH